MALKISEFLIEFFLFARYSLGGDDPYPDKKIAGFPTPLNTLTGDPERGTGTGYPPGS